MITQTTSVKNNPLRWPRKVAAWAGPVAMMTVVVLSFPANAAETLADLGPVLRELRQGGLVIFFRHASTDQTGSSEENADVSKCETQRNLSAGGRAQATQIGHAFHALGIPVGTVTTSPFCRATDTARLAFGRLAVSNDLHFAIGASETETKKLSESLRRMLSTQPAKGTNAIIVSHTANLREATGIWPKPEGVAFVFRPLPNGKFEAIAMVPPEDWAKAAELKSSGKPR